MADASDKDKIQSKFAPINAIDRPSAIEKTTKKKHLSVRIASFVGFAIVVAFVTAFMFNLFENKSETNPSSKVKSVFSDEEMRDYHSPENGFTILMPGYPDINKSSIDRENESIPVTTYKRTIENGSKNYTVAVYDYSDMDVDTDKELEKVLDSTLANTKGSKLTETEKGTYNGLPAVEATYSVSEEDKTYEAHIRFIMKGSKMYALLLIGTDQIKFDEFANTLRFDDAQEDSQ